MANKRYETDLNSLGVMYSQIEPDNNEPVNTTNQQEYLVKRAE